MLCTSCPLRPSHKCFEIESVIITYFSGNVRWIKSSSLQQRTVAWFSVYLHVWIWFLRIDSRQCDFCSFARRLQSLFCETKIQALRLVLGPTIVVQWLVTYRARMVGSLDMPTQIWCCWGKHLHCISALLRCEKSAGSADADDTADADAAYAEGAADLRWEGSA